MGYYDTKSRGKAGERTDSVQKTSYGSKVKRQGDRKGDKEQDRQWREREKLRKAELEFQKEKFKTQQRSRAEDTREKAQRDRKRGSPSRDQARSQIQKNPDVQPQGGGLPPGAEPYVAPGAEPEQPVEPSQAPQPAPPETSISPVPEKGKRFVGKDGDWAITSIEIDGEQGSFKAENQETYDVIFMNYRNGKWVYRIKNSDNKILKMASPDYGKLLQKIIDILDDGGRLLERKNMNEQNFRSIIRNLIKEILIDEEEIEEVSQTGAVAGYQTPYAFAGKKQKTNHDKMRKNAEQLGYKVVGDLPDADEVYDPSNPIYEHFVERTHTKVLKALNEGRRGCYHDFRDNGGKQPHQTIGNSLMLVRKQLSEIEKTIDMNLRLKTEAGVQSGNYWLRSHRAIRKIEEKLVRILHKMKSF